MRANTEKKLTLCLCLVMVLISGCANNQISRQTVTEPVKLSDADVQAQEPEPEVEAAVYEDSTRDNPEKPVSAEDFMNEFGSVVSVPDDITILEYKIDPEIQRGYMAFYKDDVLWNAYVKPDNIWPEVYGVYVDEYMEEIDCELDDGQITEVHGIAPELHYYRIQYDDGSEAYRLYVEWKLEDDGFQIALISYSENPIHTIPVEIWA